MTKYTVSKWYPIIIAVNVVKETEMTYTTLTPSWRGPAYAPTEARFMRKSSPLYDTWDAAQAALVDRCQRAVETKKITLAAAEADLKAAMALTPS